MIISPRAKEVTNVLRKEGGGFLKVDEVLLLRRRGLGSPYRKITYWKRGQNTSDPPPPKLTSVAIVPEMTAAVTKGCAVYGDTFSNPNASTAWRAFDRSAQNTGTFGANLWTTVSFPEVRTIRGWALQYASAPSPPFSFAIEGKRKNGEWIRIATTSVTSLVSNGYFGSTDEMECTAVRIRTSHSTLVRSCQFFDWEPLVPVTMTSNTGGGVTLTFEPNSPIGVNRYQCFTYQSSAYQHGTSNWYINNGSNKGMPSSKNQNRFFIRFAEPKTVCGFSIGGLASYTASYCYAKCIRIEGRESDSDFWRLLSVVSEYQSVIREEIEFDPSERKTRYFDFPVNHTISQLRVTVQEVTQGTSASVYLPPMQVWGG